MAQVSLAWLLARPVVTSVTVGARTVEQLTDSLAATEVGLEDKDLAELDAVSAPVPTYPKWMNDFAVTARGPVPGH
jgi:aryl-alcohol dehydrogenase-like predicted oxidoreductase